MILCEWTKKVKILVIMLIFLILILYKFSLQNPLAPQLTHFTNKNKIVLSRLTY